MKVSILVVGTLAMVFLSLACPVSAQVPILMNWSFELEKGGSFSTTLSISVMSEHDLPQALAEIMLPTTEEGFLQAFEADGVEVESLDLNIGKNEMNMTVVLQCDSVEALNQTEITDGLRYSRVEEGVEFSMRHDMDALPTKDFPEVREEMVEEMGEEVAFVLFDIADNYYVRVIVNTPGEILSAEGIDVAGEGKSASLFDKVENLARNQGINFTIVYEE